MFGFSFADRVKKIILQEFGYQLHGGVLHTLGSICDEAKATGANEYSAAIMTMFVAMNSLGVDPGDERVEAFLKEHTLNVLRVMHRANQPESDIKEMVVEILAKHGLVDRDDAEFMASDNEEDRDELADKLIQVGNAFIGSLSIYDKMFSHNARGLVADNQIQFVYFMQLWGAIDFLMQSEESDDTMTFMTVMSVLPVGADGNDLFHWEASQVGQAISQVEKAQLTDWGMRVIVSGGKSLQQILRGEEGWNSLDEVLNDVGVLSAVKEIVPLQY
jgi:hypothetical protein